ncbi:T9SS type A sorting domain-containing protein [candidate division KSB1 bacterium]|nr:T9SS type A sorting domain-containing protein [candidate division KSB1 bacterium]
MSDIETAIWQPFKDEGVVVIGISSEPESAIKQFVIDHGITFPILRDTRGVYNKYFLSGGISPYPRDFIIDRDGIIQYTNTEYDVNTMKIIVEGLIDFVSVDDDSKTNGLPSEFRLEQNYPNPFNPSTVISYSIPTESIVSLEIYNLLGQKVRTLVSTKQKAGSYRITWNGSNEEGNALTSGLYIYRFKAGAFIRSKKMFLLK